MKDKKQVDIIQKECYNDYCCEIKKGVFTMKEIEKLMALRGKVEDVEKKTVDAAIDLFNDNFKLLLNDARLLIISGVKTERDYSTVCEAMSEVGKLAERFHDDELVFPVLVTNKDARLYLAKYGKEVILK